MMLYMLAISAVIADWLQGKTKKIGNGFVVFALLSDMAMMMTPVLSDVKFYDTLPVWATVQSAVCFVMIILLAVRLAKGDKGVKIISLLAMFPMISFILDVMGVGLSLWQGGLVSEFVFIFVFVASIVVLLKVVL